jgi:hypothetical protein
MTTSDPSTSMVRIGGIAAGVVIVCFIGYFATNRDFGSHRPSRFDVNDSSSAVPSTELLIGSYPIEISDTGGRFAWIGPSARIILPFTGSEKSVKVQGWAPVSLRREKDQVSEFVVAVLANGRKIGEMRFDKDEDFERSFDLAGVDPRNGLVTIELKSESVIAPSQGDQRALSFVVNKIWLE